jgi:hypothetical protein
MSIYWMPDNDEPPSSPTSRAPGRDIAALIFEQPAPWDAPAVRALLRRIVARARDTHRRLPSDRARVLR